MLSPTRAYPQPTHDSPRRRPRQRQRHQHPDGGRQRPGALQPEADPVDADTRSLLPPSFLLPLLGCCQGSGGAGLLVGARGHEGVRGRRKQEGEGQDELLVSLHG